MYLLKKLILLFIAIFIIAFLIAIFIPKEKAAPIDEKEEITITKKPVTEIPEITAESALIRFVSTDGSYEEDLFEKNYKEIRLIASVTKLMTALIAEENVNKSMPITITETVANDRNSSFLFKGGEKWSYDSLLHLMLLPSNNDAAESFANTFGYRAFIDKMNAKAFELGLKDTSFVNPSGLEEEKSNMSNADEVAKLIIYIQKKYPKIIEVSRQDEFIAYDIERSKSITATSTNILLRFSSFPLIILGGKTGETPNAKKNLALITEAPNKKGYLVFVVLKSNENFADTARLAHWAVDSFEWR